MNKLLLGTTTDPWHNLAVEEMLFDNHKEGVTLYLWQNKHTVVIGRNQNAWRECRAEALDRDGGRLARRTTGGGAVYHDLGNLNFTFVTRRDEYDLQRQLSVILAAVRSLGVDAGFTGRNDLVTADGAKFSGNAFRFSRETGMHHGTIIVNVDMENLGRYLSPSPAKLQAKGVESVRARVCNLNEYGNHITIASVRQAVMEAFQNEYGAYAVIAERDLPAAALAAAEARHGSWEWRMGATPAFDLTLETRFPWGGLELALSLDHGTVHSACVYSDAMDEAFIRELSAAFAGVMFTHEAMAGAARAVGGPQAEDVAQWLAEAEW